MQTPTPAKRPGRKKVPTGRRYSERIVFRVRPAQYARLRRRAEELGLNANDYARDRALGRVRATRAQRRLASEGAAALADLSGFVEFAQALLPHLETHFGPADELGQVIRRAQKRFPDPAGLVRELRTLIEQAVAP
ncbi:MAG TPA: hypothetical protein VFR37_05410 [Longimicrobium sp.]|nr:hypothetical protein [Longimicrobium sp.]